MFCEDRDMILDLTPDELLSTTRAVRKRLDLERPVEREVLEECLRLAQQAPTASYSQNWHFVVVTDDERRAALADLWRRGGAAPYMERRREAARAVPGGGGPMTRIVEAVMHLATHLHEVPVHVIPCVEGRTENAPVPTAGRPGWASILPRCLELPVSPPARAASAP